MNRVLSILLMLGFVVPCAFGADKPVVISDLVVRGEIEGENITFDLTFKADVLTRNTVLPLVAGDVAHLDSDLPRRAELSRKGGVFYVKFPTRGKQDVRFRFASRAAKDGVWRDTSFAIPSASVRKLSVVCDRDDLEVVFPGALNVQKQKNKEGKTEITAFLGIADTFEVRWKPAVKKLAGELVVACDANTIASASVGALKLDNIFTYRVVQGALKEVKLSVPMDLNVTQVKGDDIQDWTIDVGAKGSRALVVTLGRAQEKDYRLHVESEMVLPQFPCKLSLPVMVPQDVIRSSGFLMLGTDSAIKLLVEKALGLTQINQTAFSVMSMGRKGGRSRVLPSGSRFAYQYANTPYTLALSADDIVPQYSSDEQLMLSVEDNDLVLEASVELDVRDAPAREIVIQTDVGWTVANVSSAAMSDYDVTDAAPKGAKGKQKKRLIHIYFRDAVQGRALINVRMEQSMDAKQKLFKVPEFTVVGAKSERGYLVLAAEKGLRLKEDKASGIREVQTGSVGRRVHGAQLAYRYKEGGWALSVLLERTIPTVYSEVFHLVSIGEGVLYCSAVVTYRIEGAPVRAFEVQIPEEFQNVEFIGRDIRGWDHEGEKWKISLQEKVIGDYTLGITYDKPFNYTKQTGGTDIAVGEVTTLGVASESGYIVLASSASLNLATLKADDTIIGDIETEEVPKAYTLFINDPILKAYKYTSAPHVALIKVVQYDTEPLIDQVSDHTAYVTEISKDGEAVTTVTYSVKNLSRQYLAITLPEGAALWSTKCSNEEELLVAVPSLSDHGKTLIPVRRLHNPNTPVTVEVQYAQSVKALEGMGRKLTFVAPASSDMNSTFAKWTFSIPEEFVVARAGGNMTLASIPWSRGLASVLSGVWDLVGIGIKVYPGWLLLTVVISIGALVCASASGAGRSSFQVIGIALLFGFFAVVSGVVIQAWLGRQVSPQIAQTMDAAQEGGGSVVSVTRTVSQADTEASTVVLRVVPRWIGANGSALLAACAVILGFVVLSRAGTRGGDRSCMHTALALTFVTIGAAELAMGKTVLIALFTFGLPLLIMIRLITLAYRSGRQMWQPVAPAAPVSGAVPPPFEPDGTVHMRSDGDKEGRASVALLAMIAFIGVGIAVQVEGAKKSVEAAPTMSSVVIEAIAPSMDVDDEKEKSARVAATYEFEAETPVSFIILHGPAVLTEQDLGSRHLSIGVSDKGYVLKIKKKGNYEVSLKYSVPVVERGGAWFMGLDVPENLRNKVTIRIPEKELDVESPAAVFLKTKEANDESTVTVIYGSARKAYVSWRARARKTKLEKVVFFCEVNTMAIFEPGVVDLTNLIRYQIAQGEIKAMKILVPKGMSVTAVSAPGLSTWRFDPDTRLLEAVLEKPVSGDFEMRVTSQVGCEGLPYDALIGSLQVRDAVRQRGSIAFAVANTVQVRIDEPKGLNAMNIEDVSPDAAALVRRGTRTRRSAEIKRAFRYHSLPVSAAVHADRVLPEIRVEETASLSVSDERVVLSTKLNVAVSKAGIFSLRLGIPGGFDVETLSGRDVSHWDEVGDGKKGGRAVVIHFKKQVQGTSVLNLVIARMEKGLGKTLEVPHVTADNVLKHTGKLVVSGERGVRMTTVERQGVSETNPRDDGIRSPGALAFRILRPDWKVTLRAEIVDPTIRAEVLHRVDLSEGMMHCVAYVRYRIDNAGCKIFKLKAPAPEIPLAVTGIDIAKVTKIDDEQGIWAVELHNKREDRYAIAVRYQMPIGKESAAKVLPIATVGVDSQKGYLVVMSGGRVQILPVGEKVGLKREDARSIPAYFGAEGLADAIQCYRTISGNYELSLSVVRPDAAKVLPASVHDVRMTSVMSDDGQVLTRVVLNMTVGTLPVLEMTLPGESTRLWSAFVKGKAASVSKDGDKYRIPLDEPVPGENTTVEFTYAAMTSRRWFSSEQTYTAPRFDLPLRNMEWLFYVVPGRRYYGFGGTMDHEEPEEYKIARFDREGYQKNNRRQINTDNMKARKIMAEGEQLARDGKQYRAKKALALAINYSKNDLAFNEDARIQYKNLAEQQAVVGLIQRRDKMRFDRNIQDAGQIQRLEQFKGGDFTAQYASDVQQSLSTSENASMRRLVGKMLAQQEAAQRVAQAIAITMPLHGQELRFSRGLQINTDQDTVVSFKVGSGGGWRWSLLLVSALGVMFVYRILLCTGRKKASAA